MNEYLKRVSILPEIADEEVVGSIRACPAHYGAGAVVDLGNGAQWGLSLGIAGAGSGLMYAASGGVIGLTVDMLHANNYCNLFAAGTAVFTSGQLRLQVQTSDTDTSGNFTDPTSGLAAFPGAFTSGGILTINSGQLGGGLLGALTSGQSVQSGWALAQAFQRPGRFVRVNMISGDFYAGTLTAGVVSQIKTTGSGGGFTYSPGSGSISV